jgi:hypothetical protein
MIEFASMKFFLILKEASQKGIDLNEQVLEKEYTGFIRQVSVAGMSLTEKAVYRFSLVCARVELISLSKKLSGKKMRPFTLKRSLS